MTTAAVPNRLIKEKSPYLLQHAHNPVDWYPWGSEAFEKAKKEDKPILVSIGYSTCHWCHVMEHESFERTAVAELMNRSLVCIKVDREERPDVDKIYMTAVSAMTGSGGWPLNVFLTPELKPFFGGTYFPPEAKWGHPAWKEVIRQIADAWAHPEQRKKIMASGDQLTEAIRQSAQQAGEPLDGKPQWLDQGFAAFAASYDKDRGGFSPAPKFPMPVYMNFLLRYYVRSGNAEALKMVDHTLLEMSRGGIYDHLGGGFARYSTDGQWHVPHFEKMLYDNAQLAVNYLEAYQLTRDPVFAQVARETLDYVLREMTGRQGGFFSAQDADSLPSSDASHKVEGAFYVWEKPEIYEVLDKAAADIFCFRYGVRENGNAATDPHGEFKNKNILYIAHPIPEAARRFGLSEAETEKLLADSRQKLFQRRSQRPRPHLDDKVISAWNGLMISAFCKGCTVLGEEKYKVVAQRAAQFLQDHLYDASTHVLYRRWREEDRQVPGIADDYAFVIQALLDLYETDFDIRWLAWARALTDQTFAQFYDGASGGFFMSASDEGKDLLVRVKEDADNVEPSASSVMALNLLRLYERSQRPEDLAASQKTLRGFGQSLSQMPRALPQMLVALDWSLSGSRQIVISGNAAASDTRELFRRLRRNFIPVKTVFLLENGAVPDELARALPFLKGMHPIEGRATAYICANHTCQAPTNDPDVFEKMLRPS